MELSLARLPWYAQIGAFLALAGAAAGVYYSYYELPARAQMSMREGQLRALRADIEKGRLTAKKLPDSRGQVEELEVRLDGLRAVLPEEKDAADLLRRMQTVATQSNLTIKSFKPAPIVMKQLHAEWPITLELDGTYHNLAAFFDRVGRFTRIVNVSDLDVKGKDRPATNSTITASCVATTFVLLEKPEAATSGAKAPSPRPATAGKAA